MGYYAALYVARICDSHYPHLREDLKRIIARLAPARHSEDFSEVYWFGKPFYFTPIKSRVIAALWQAWQNGTPVLSSRFLANAAACETQKLSDIFKDDPAWGLMVQFDGVGKYWLQPPTDTVSKIVRWLMKWINRLFGRNRLAQFSVF